MLNRTVVVLTVSVIVTIQFHNPTYSRPHKFTYFEGTASARDNNVLDVIRKGEKLGLEQWADFFLENYSKPPVRAEKTHQVNLRVAKHLKGAFASRKLVDITADDIELYLRDRLRTTVRIRTALGHRQMGTLKPTTVHQELRVLRRMLNVAVRKKLLQANPCWGVEFPVAVRGLFRPHYVTWSEQRRIESHGPAPLRNVVQIITETGLRVYKELTPMKKDQVDLVNATVWIPDSKTPNGIAEIPLTPLAIDAFKSQMMISGDGPFLFPQRQKPVRSLQEPQDRVAENAQTRRSSLLPDL